MPDLSEILGANFQLTHFDAQSGSSTTLTAQLDPTLSATVDQATFMSGLW